MLRGLGIARRAISCSGIFLGELMSPAEAQFRAMIPTRPDLKQHRRACTVAAVLLWLSSAVYAAP
ncbi:MAG: hypothetical protein RL580_1916, partial [Pseudomonadota bacterium]